MENSKLQEILKLSRDERLEIVKSIWDSIAEEQDNMEIPKDQLVELKKRLEKIKNGKAKFIQWEDVEKIFEGK